MTTFKRRFFHPLLWAVTGFLVAVFGNRATGWHGVPYADAMLTAIAFGVLRWLHGEWRWRIHQQYMDRATEQQVRDALMILRHSPFDGARKKAIGIVVGCLVRAHAVREDFQDQFR